jgi:hypothetical protein
MKGGDPDDGVAPDWDRMDRKPMREREETA